MSSLTCLTLSQLLFAIVRQLSQQSHGDVPPGGGESRTKRRPMHSPRASTIDGALWKRRLSQSHQCWLKLRRFLFLFALFLSLLFSSLLLFWFIIYLDGRCWFSLQSLLSFLQRNSISLLCVESGSLAASSHSFRLWQLPISLFASTTFALYPSLDNLK